jgi:hypothetical protein
MQEVNTVSPQIKQLQHTICHPNWFFAREFHSKLKILHYSIAIWPSIVITFIEKRSKTIFSSKTAHCSLWCAGSCYYELLYTSLVIWIFLSRCFSCSNRKRVSPVTRPTLAKQLSSNCHEWSSGSCIKSRQHSPREPQPLESRWS